MVRRRAQHRVWDAVAWITVALGLACAVMVWGVGRTAASAAGVFVVAFVLVALAGKAVWASTRISFDVAVVVVGFAGLLATFGWLGALVALAVVATAPTVRVLLRPGHAYAVMRLMAPRHGTAPPGAVTALGRVEPDTDRTAAGPVGPLVSLAEVHDLDGVAALDDQALCQAWRRSFVRLESSRVVDARLEVVRMRQLYLDELVRRHPTQVRHWLSSGARAAGNPFPFLEHPCFGTSPREEGERGGPAGDD